MRTTLHLDEDLVAQLKSESRQTGRSFRDIINETLRHGLGIPQVVAPREPFRIEARDLGALKPGLSLDKLGELLDQAESSSHR